MVLAPVYGVYSLLFRKNIVSGKTHFQEKYGFGRSRLSGKAEKDAPGPVSIPSACGKAEPWENPTMCSTCT